MRNSTIVGLGLALIAALPVGAEAASPLKMFKTACEAQNGSSKVRKSVGQEDVAKEYMKMSEMAAKFKPTVTKTYGWTGKKWVLDESITYTYDPSGLPMSEMSVDAEGDYSNTVYVYNENGKVTFKESKVSSNGVDFENYKKTEFDYDPVLTNVITRRTEWLWMDFGKGPDWQLVGNNYKRTITRDEAGNVTSVVISVLFGDYYDPTQRLDITYGDDGKATKISEQLLNYDGREYFWEQGMLITDIQWENTDGQIYDPEDLFLGNNRIKSAHYEDVDDMSFDVNVEYASDNDGYTVTMNGAMGDDEMGSFEVGGTVVYTPLENDGYLMEGTTTFMGFVMYHSREELRYDDWGHMTLQYYEEEEDGEIFYEKTIGEVEYDAEGRPASYTVSEEYMDPNSGEVMLENAFRAEYADYVDVTTGVGNPVAADGDVRYFNLQGLEVKAPAKGEILIKKQGEKVVKIKY